MADSETSQTKGIKTYFHKVSTKMLKILTTWSKFCIKPSNKNLHDNDDFVGGGGNLAVHVGSWLAIHLPWRHSHVQPLQ